MSVTLVEHEPKEAAQSVTSAPRCAVLTLGCKVNQAESEEIRERFTQAGFKSVAFRRTGGSQHNKHVHGDSCGRPEVAPNDPPRPCCHCQRHCGSYRVLRRRVARRSGGSGARRAGSPARPTQRLSRHRLGGASRAWRGQSRELLSPEELAYAAVFQPTKGRTRSRVFVKVQDGCWHACAYCIVPRARGRSVSRPASEIVRRVQALHGEGVAEVVLTGVCIGDYEDPDSGGSLTALIQRLLNETAIPRIRISSINPMHFDYAFLELFAHSRICRHLHLPLQSGSPHILQRMNRRHTLDEYRAIVRRARQICPEIALTTDVLVGFPGETEEHFAETAAFIEEMEFADLHVFPYSVRPRTSAAHFDAQVPFGARKQRVQQLIAQRARTAPGIYRAVSWQVAGRGLGGGSSGVLARVFR